MALIKVKDLLKHAEENGYGVPAINVFDYNSIKFAVMAAEEAHMPLIIQYYPGFKEISTRKDVREAGKELNSRFQGKGGGQPSMVQGTLMADGEEIRSFFLDALNAE